MNLDRVSPSHSRDIQQFPIKRKKKQRPHDYKSDDRKTTEAVLSIIKGEEKSPNDVKNKVSDITEVVREEIVKTEDTHQLVLSESEIFKREGFIEEQPIDLEALLRDLSKEAQDKFETNLEEQQEIVSSFQSIFSKNNKKYIVKSSQLKTPSIQKEFHQLRETEKKQYQELITAYTKLKQIFTSRIEALNEAIASHMFESYFLSQTIRGNSSYRNSFSVWNFSLGYLYGATYRLGEISQSLEERRKAIGIKEDDKPSLENSEIIDIITPSESCQNLTKISREIALLKEEVTICNEALKTDKQRFTATTLPRQYYIYHMQCLKNINDSLAKLNEDLEKQVSQLREDLKLEVSTPNSPKALACQRELSEIETRKTAILHRQNEIKDLLAQRKKEFKFSEEGLEKDESVKLEDFSPQYTKALSLIERIIALKEDIVLSKAWESFDSSKQRCLTYFQNAEKLKEFSESKSNFESEALPERKKMIESAVMTYQGYIVNMQQSMKAIETHFKLLEKDSLERAGWQVAPPPVPKKQVGPLNEESKVVLQNEQKESIEASDKKNET